MRIIRILIAVLILSSLAGIVSAQRRGATRIAHDVRISKKHPTVYITFERVGKREPRRLNESGRGVWLRLHNNTRWVIDVPAYGLPNLVFTNGKEKEVGLLYKAAAVPPPSTRLREIPAPPTEEEPKCEVPMIGYIDLRSSIELAPGESKLFSVAREHLCNNLYIFVNFSYAWERDSFDDPQHSVRFYGFEIPKDAR
jgi:hypothetical protein